MILRDYERFLHLPANPCKLLQVLIYLNCSMILRDLDRFLLEPYKKILQVLDKLFLYDLERSLQDMYFQEKSWKFLASSYLCNMILRDQERILQERLPTNSWKFLLM